MRSHLLLVWSDCTFWPRKYEVADVPQSRVSRQVSRALMCRIGDWSLKCFTKGRSNPMRSIILYIVGIPISVIVLIALFTHHF